MNSLRILADECVMLPIVEMLRTAGHDVYYVMENTRQIPDTEVLKIALEQNRILLTNDKEFAAIASDNAAVAGVVFMRLHGLSGGLRATIMEKFFATHQVEGECWVVRPSGAKRI